MIRRTFFLVITLFLSTFWSIDSMAFELSSSAFNQGGKIPSQYTCDGTNISPPLVWKDAPADTKSFVLIMNDPDAPVGIWDHWVIYNIPSSITSLAENIRQLPENTLEGKNSWSHLGYGGPCPPDKEHRYFFKIYALDTALMLNTGMTSQEIEKAIEGHVLGTAELMGKYQRSK